MSKIEKEYGIGSEKAKDLTESVMKRWEFLETIWALGDFGGLRIKNKVLLSKFLMKAKDAFIFNDQLTGYYESLKKAKGWNVPPLPPEADETAELMVYSFVKSAFDAQKLLFDWIIKSNFIEAQQEGRHLS